jgi:hypothetical protein
MQKQIACRKLARSCINFSASCSGGVVPINLVDTGCVSNANPTQVAAGFIPHDVSVAFWSDGAVKERWTALPDGQNIAAASNGDWAFPYGSMLMKRFRANGSLVETRLLIRHSGGNWSGYI